MIALFASARAVTAVTVPNGFTVKNTFTGTTLGLPVNLGGLAFSPDGNFLYVVGAADTTSSAVYRLGVTRDANNRYVTGFVGPACQVFASTVAMSDVGIDAGLEFVPTGTLFYSYFDANLLAERVGAFGCAQVPTSTETKYNMTQTVALPRSVAGLTFSPFRIDPNTGFGTLQVSTGYASSLYEMMLSAPSGGFYTPTSKTLFVTLPKGDLGNLQYVPSAPYQGNLMYAAFADGEVHMIAIDQPTGLPIDSTTGMPLQGTTHPVDTVFASGFGSDTSAGPLGLEFDQRSGDLFVATWQGTPDNSIIQIGGFAVPVPSTTTTTSTTAPPTTTSTTTTSTTTTSAPPPTTTTSFTSTTTAPATTTTTQSTTPTTTTTSSTTTSTAPETTTSSTTTVPPTTTTTSTTTTSTTTSSTTTTTAHATTTTTTSSTTTTTSTTTATQPTTTTTTTASSTTTVPTTTTLPTTTTTSSTTSTTAPTTSTTLPASTTTTATSSTTTTTRPVATCGTPGSGSCDDGDPCTVDGCAPTSGCTPGELTGFASATCVCERPAPAVCLLDTLPALVEKRRARACVVMADAALKPTAKRQRIRLHAALGRLRAALSAATRATKSGRLSPDCGLALQSELRDEIARVTALLASL